MVDVTVELQTAAHPDVVTEHRESIMINLVVGRHLDMIVNEIAMILLPDLGIFTD